MPPSKIIPLTKGKYTIVDDKDFEWLNKFKWHFGSHGYVVTTVNYRKVLMHRLINKTPENFETDHINRDKLDNRRSNLRTVTQSQNGFNRGPQKNNKSGIKGISWEKDRNKWSAELTINQKRVYRQRFNSLQEAISGRQEAEEKYNII
jgi:hypothetical protein